MQEWAGLERFLQLSLASQAGGNAVALLAVLELKRMLQQGMRTPEKGGKCLVLLTAEEWRSLAGIHERKTFERAKNKLEELGVLQIERQGKLLLVEIWPESPNFEEQRMEQLEQKIRPIHLAGARTRARFRYRLQINRSSVGIGSSKTKGIAFETSDTTSSRTIDTTSYGTSIGTEDGTSRGTAGETGRRTTDGTGSSLISGDILLRRVSGLTLNVNPVFRYSLNRYYYFNKSKQQNNEQRFNEQRVNESRSSCKSNVKSPSGIYSLVSNDKSGIPRLESKKLVDNPREEIAPGIGPAFACLWESEMGHPLTPYELEGLLCFQRLGYRDELFREALCCAVAADKRRMGYVLGILRNWYQEGVRGVEDLATVRERWQDQRFIARVRTG
ncbi:MAG: DnaD domain-containing protein [Desulfitobacteriaceae bacterium]